MTSAARSESPTVANKISFFIRDLEKRITAIFSDLGNDGFAHEKQHYSILYQRLILYSYITIFHKKKIIIITQQRPDNKF